MRRLREVAGRTVLDEQVRTAFWEEVEGKGASKDMKWTVLEHLDIFSHASSLNPHNQTQRHPLRYTWFAGKVPEDHTS